eukprot:3788-Heterococcus_DN1.PRE.8
MAVSTAIRLCHCSSDWTPYTTGKFALQWCVSASEWQRQVCDSRTQLKCMPSVLISKRALHALLHPVVQRCSHSKRLFRTRTSA